MKLKTLLLTTALVASSVAFADAPAPSKKKNNQYNTFYAKVEGGLSMPTKNKVTKGTVSVPIKWKKNGLVGGIGGGYKFNDFLRSDLMLQYRQVTTSKVGAETTKGKLKGYTAILNGYLDAHNDTIFTPYLMAGAGLSVFKGKSFKKTTKSFVWNAGLGCQAKVQDSLNLGLEYRHTKLFKSLKGTEGGVALKTKAQRSNEILASLTYDIL